MNSQIDDRTDGAPGAWAKALVLMQRALMLLDGTADAAEVGAHLDLAAHRLQEHMLRLGLAPAHDEPPSLIFETL